MQKRELKPKAESQTQLNSENDMQKQPDNTPNMSTIVVWSEASCPVSNSSKVIMCHTI